MAMAEQGI